MQRRRPATDCRRFILGGAEGPPTVRLAGRIQFYDNTTNICAKEKSH